MKRRTVSADDLETLARAAHADIELPGPEGGWATATINGHAYRARVAAVPVSPERARILGALRSDHWALSNDEIEALADALTEAAPAEPVEES